MLPKGNAAGRDIVSKTGSPRDVLDHIARNLVKMRDLKKQVTNLEEVNSTLEARLVPLMAEKDKRYLRVEVYHSYTHTTEVVCLERYGDAVCASLVPAEDADALEWPAEPGHTVNPDVPLIDTEALVAADEAE